MIWPAHSLVGTMFCMKKTAMSSVLLLVVLCSWAQAQKTGGGPRIPILNAIGGLPSVAAGLGSSATVTNPGEAAVTIRDGIRIHTVETPYQNGRQEIHVLLPASYRKDKSYRVLYVLPVEKGFDQKYGYGLGILKEMNAHSKPPSPEGEGFEFWRRVETAEAISHSSTTRKFAPPSAGSSVSWSRMYSRITSSVTLPELATKYPRAQICRPQKAF